MGRLKIVIFFSLLLNILFVSLFIALFFWSSSNFSLEDSYIQRVKVEGRGQVDFLNEDLADYYHLMNHIRPDARSLVQDFTGWVIGSTIETEDWQYFQNFSINQWNPVNEKILVMFNWVLGIFWLYDLNE